MYKDFDELRSECLKCTKCGLCQGRHNVVFGVGNPKAKVLFVGDSFVWDLETYMPWREFMDYVEIWFYNKSAFLGFEKEKHPIGCHLSNLVYASLFIFFLCILFRFLYVRPCFCHFHGKNLFSVKQQLFQSRIIRSYPAHLCRLLFLICQ